MALSAVSFRFLVFQLRVATLLPHKAIWFGWFRVYLFHVWLYQHGAHLEVDLLEQEQPGIWIQVIWIQNPKIFHWAISPRQKDVNFVSSHQTKWKRNGEPVKSNRQNKIIWTVNSWTLAIGKCPS